MTVPYTFTYQSGIIPLSELDANFDAVGASSNVAYSPAGTGAVVTTVQTKLRESVSVKDFGAVGNGVADDTAAIQLAVNAGVTVVFPTGTYKITSPVYITTSNKKLITTGCTIDCTSLVYDAGVRASGCAFIFSGTFRGQTTLAASTLAGDRSINITAATGAQVGDIVRVWSPQVLYHNDTSDANYTDINVVTDVSGTVLSLETEMLLPFDSVSYAVTVRLYQPITGCSVEGPFNFLGGGVTASLANGNGRCGIYFLACQSPTVRGCRFEGFQGIAIYLEYCVDTLCANLEMVGILPTITIVEGTNSGFYGVYNVRTRRAIVQGCKSLRIRHLADGLECFEYLQIGNTCVKSHRAAFGSHESVFNLNIVGNVANDCYAGVVVRAWTTSISGNVFNVESACVTTSVMLDTDTAGTLSITGNTLKSKADTLAAIAISGIFSPTHISGNDIYNNLGSGVAFYTPKLDGVVISGNTVKAAAGVQIFDAATSRNSINKVVIIGNTFFDYTANMIAFRGSLLPSVPADYIKIIDNSGFPQIGASGNGILLRAEGYYGDYIVIRGNTQWGDSSATVAICPGAFWRVASWPITEFNDSDTKTSVTNRAVFDNTTASVGTDATLLRNHVINKIGTNSATPSYWVVSSAGTEGSFTGVTGSVNSGSSALTLVGNTNAKAYRGSYITIAGAGVASANLNTRILTISDDFTTATIETAASTTVSGAAITRKTPTLVATANLV
jgi:hypothetical protein